MKERMQKSAVHFILLGAMVVCAAVLRFFPAWALAQGPTCMFRALFHLNCPFCGMTRDFVAILHGHKPLFNPFSWAAAVTIYLIYPALFFWAWLKGRLSLFFQPAVHRLVVIALLVMFVFNNFSI